MRQIRGFFFHISDPKCTESDLKKSPDLSREPKCSESDLNKSPDLSNLGLIWPTLGQNLVTLRESNKLGTRSTHILLVRAVDNTRDGSAALIKM